MFGSVHPSQRGRGAAIAALAMVVASLGACGGDDAAADLPPLLTADDLGSGWIESETTPVPLAPAAVAPPCPFTADRPDVVVSAADSVELSNEEAMLGVVHTVVELDGDAAAAGAVVDTWATMDCSGSDFDQSTVDGLPADVLGVELSAQEGSLTQVVLVETDGSTMSFLVVSGDGRSPVDLARRLA